MNVTLKALYVILIAFSVALLLTLLASCGSLVPDNANFSGKSFVSESADYYAEAQFAELQDCTGIYEGTLGDITLVFTEPALPCRDYDGWCGGTFDTASMTIRMGGWFIFKHEALHYLLWITKGDLEHNSAFFQECT